MLTYYMTTLKSPLISVQSQLTWIEDAAGYAHGIHPATLAPHSTMVEYMRWITKKSGSDKSDLPGGSTLPIQEDEADWEEKGPEGESDRTQVPPSFSFFGHKLTSVALHAYVGDFERAHNALDVVTSKACLINLLKKPHKEALLYFADALQWSLSVLSWELNKAGEEDKGSPYMEVDACKLRRRFVNLQLDCESNAVIWFFKGRLAQRLNVRDEVTLEIFTKCTELDPNLPEWYHHLYRNLRRIRKNVGSSGSHFTISSKPITEEREVSEKAYQLAPYDCVSTTNLAIMIKECLWSEESLVWEENETEYMRCVTLFRKAIDIASIKGDLVWIKKTKIYLGEFLLFGRGSKLNQEEGMSLFQDVLHISPNCSMLLHKMGKLYAYGAERTQRYKDATQAEVCYKRALEVNGKNYRCLMDYLKFLKSEAASLEPERGRLFYTSMLDALNSSLKVVTRSHEVVELLIHKGLIIWLLNPTRASNNWRLATEVWVNALKRFPEFEQKICGKLTGPFLGDWRARVNIHSLVKRLECMQVANDTIMKDANKARAISTLLKNLKPANPT